MGLFNKLKDNFKSSDFSVAGNSKVKTLKKNFEKSFNGAVLRVYYGTTFSNEDYSIAKIRNKENPGSGQEFKAKASWTVKRLEEAFMESFGIKVQVALPGDRNLADNDATLWEVSRSK